MVHDGLKPIESAGSISEVITLESPCSVDERKAEVICRLISGVFSSQFGQKQPCRILDYYSTTEPANAGKSPKNATHNTGKIDGMAVCKLAPQNKQVIDAPFRCRNLPDLSANLTRQVR
jgi:hypothetical protein